MSATIRFQTSEAAAGHQEPAVAVANSTQTQTKERRPSSQQCLTLGCLIDMEGWWMIGWSSNALRSCAFLPIRSERSSRAAWCRSKHFGQELPVSNDSLRSSSESCLPCISQDRINPQILWLMTNLCLGFCLLLKPVTSTVGGSLIWFDYWPSMFYGAVSISQTKQLCISFRKELTRSSSSGSIKSENLGPWLPAWLAISCTAWQWQLYMNQATPERKVLQPHAPLIRSMLHMNFRRQNSNDVHPGSALRNAKVGCVGKDTLALVPQLVKSQLHLDTGFLAGDVLDANVGLRAQGLLKHSIGISNLYEIKISISISK